MSTLLRNNHKQPKRPHSHLQTDWPPEGMPLTNQFDSSWLGLNQAGVCQDTWCVIHSPSAALKLISAEEWDYLRTRGNVGSERPQPSCLEKDNLKHRDLHVRTEHTGVGGKGTKKESGGRGKVKRSIKSWKGKGNGDKKQRQGRKLCACFTDCHWTLASSPREDGGDQR